MTDRTHHEFNERWVEFVRDNPRSVWHPQLKAFLDSQIIIANRFYKELAEERGDEFVRELRLKR